jgi:hypothetical protein
VENFKDPRTNQILYYYFVIKGGWNLEPFLFQLWILTKYMAHFQWWFSKNQSIDSCKVEQVHIYYLLRKVVCLLDWDLSNHRPLLAHLVSLESHEWVSMHQGCNVETSNSEVIEYWTILSLKIQQH